MQNSEHEEYYLYLDELQKSGQTNMFGAARYLQEEFTELDRFTSEKITKEWMDNYEERHNIEPDTA